MQDYGPFDKPYGAATWSGLKERLKGLLVVALSELIFICWLAMNFVGELIFRGGSYDSVILGLIFIISIPVLTFSIILHILGVVWAFKPEWKPELRQRLAW